MLSNNGKLGGIVYSIWNIADDVLCFCRTILSCLSTTAIMMHSVSGCQIRSSSQRMMGRWVGQLQQLLKQDVKSFR